MTVTRRGLFALCGMALVSPFLAFLPRPRPEPLPTFKTHQALSAHDLNKIVAAIEDLRRQV